VRSGQQTTRNWAWRDYGNRIGNWRLFEILDQLKLPATILLNSSVCYNYPEIVDKIKARGDDVVGHGRTNAELLRGMWEDDEARAIQECTDIIAKHVGVRPTGWMGPGALESNVTPDLLKEAGYTHLLDWPFDDQPIWMQTRAGPLLSVPYPMELNDAGTLAHRDHTGREFADMIVDQFEEMLEQSERHPLVFALSLHGFIVGQPFRLRPLRQAIRHCVEHKARDRVWYTRAGDIAKAKQMVIGIEPLRKQESNIINTGAEALRLVSEVNHPQVKMIIDYYHLRVEKEDPEIVRTARNQIVHLHFANPSGRLWPKLADEDAEYQRFFSILKQINYTGGLSIEGTGTFENDAAASLSFFRGELA